MFEEVTKLAQRMQQILGKDVFIDVQARSFKTGSSFMGFKVSIVGDDINSTRIYIYDSWKQLIRQASELIYLKLKEDKNEC